MAIVNSKKKQLEQGEIIVHAVLDAGLKGQEAAVAMSKVVVELQQPNCYGTVVGNTLFISHTNETKDSVFLRVINVDNNKNLINNVEVYVRRAKHNGVKTIVYADPDSSHVAIMEHLKKSHLAIVQMERSKKTGWYVFVVTFPEEYKKAKEQPVEEAPVEEAPEQ